MPTELERRQAEIAMRRTNKMLQSLPEAHRRASVPQLNEDYEPRLFENRMAPDGPVFFLPPKDDASVSPVNLMSLVNTNQGGLTVLNFGSYT